MWLLLFQAGNKLLQYIQKAWIKSKLGKRCQGKFKQKLVSIYLNSEEDYSEEIAHNAN